MILAKEVVDLEKYVPAWLLAVMGTLIVVTTIAALSRKPPLSWVGRYIAWVFGRLIGEPISRWLSHFLDERVGRDLDQKIDHLHDCIELAAADADAAARSAVEAVKLAEGVQGALVQHVETTSTALVNMRARQLAIAEHVGVDIGQLVRDERDVETSQPRGLLGGDGSVR